MKIATIDLYLQVYSLVVLSLSVFIISGAICIYKRRKIKKCMELEMIMQILYADLLWSIVTIVENVQSITLQRIVLSDIFVSMASFFLYISMSFATLIAFCAFKTFNDPGYLYKHGFYRISMLVGYVFPTVSTLIELILYLYKFDLKLQFEGTKIQLAYPPIIYSLICVCLSLLFYLSIQRSLSKYELADNVKSEINTLFLFPMIIFIFVSIPNVCVVIIGLDKNANLTFINYIDLVIVMMIPFYGMVNCLAYGKSIRLMEERNSQQHRTSFDDNLQISLVESAFIQQQYDNE